MTTDQGQCDSTTPALPEIPHWLCLCCLAVFVLATLSNVLFFNPGEVLSDGRMDTGLYFVHWRAFEVHELKSGNLPLWNPHCYCGEPFFGNFQSALLYPLNFLYLIIPLAPAINWTIALHLFLGGAFTFYWARNRGVHSLAALLAGTIFMFCGPHFLQIQAGHLPNLCTLIWAPLLFLAIDRMIDKPSLAPCLLGMLATAMSVFAGHAQHVFYTAVIAGIYSILNLTRARGQAKAILGLAGIAFGGIALSAVQLFTGLDEGSESLRSIGMSYEFAGAFSFPPENLLTLLAPDFFGDGKTVEYWGRWYVTEASIFVSIAGLALAVFALARGTPRMRRFSTTMLIIAIILAMGRYTPLFHFLYAFIPGFNLFRGTNKFLVEAALFLSMLAAIGLDLLLRGENPPWWLIGAAIAAGIGLLGLVVLPTQIEWWAALLQRIPPTHSSWWPTAMYSDPNFIARSQPMAIYSLLWGAACLFAAAWLLVFAGKHRALACRGLLGLTLIEFAIFTHHSLMTFKIKPPYPYDITETLKENLGDSRIRAENPNRAMSAGILDVGGDDPSGLLRYVRFYDFTQGIDYDVDPYYKKPTKYPKRELRLLRCKYIIAEKRDICIEVPNPLPRLLLIDHFWLMRDYHEIFSTLIKTNFDAAKEVILESPPNPAPQANSDKGTVKLVNSSTDYLTIDAEVKSPCLLLVTDSYSRNWRIRPLPGSSQTEYQIVPADYCLRAVPLAAGHHSFRMEYSPLGYRVGKVVSIAAWIVFLPLAVFVLRPKIPSAA